MVPYDFVRGYKLTSNPATKLNLRALPRIEDLDTTVISSFQFTKLELKRTYNQESF